ncbi:hypothetical protein LYNGBM3L_25250 [Moorena producens 3L]|uniref:Uncharacterized protein n=1 Tax=Moorena producens 3L TaxID=489825 RepID=F4XNT2_9CYAN|nr:hypothetical protein LYNGBM3L_25250 [Moorena producens 3L]
MIGEQTIVMVGGWMVEGLKLKVEGWMVEGLKLKVEGYRLKV